MRPFLDQVAEFLLKEDRPLHRQTVILPSRRAAVFLQRSLQEQLTKPALAPRMLSIEDLVIERTGLELIARPTLYFRLYETFIEGLRPNLNFGEFARWGMSLIQDFNEIDRYLVDPEEVFSYLGDLKRIEQWNLEPGEHTKMLDDYLRFWPDLSQVYQDLSLKLLKEGLAWQGLAYRQFAEKSVHEIDSDEHFYFVGFNALNKAEEKALLHLYDQGKASFFWDIDEYYFNNPEQEAGHFLRRSPLLKQLRKRDDFHGLHQKLSENAREVRSIAVAGNNLQAVVASNIISEKSEVEKANTALILSDEALLPAFLNNISADFPSLNLSMGLSLQHSPLAGFFEVLLDFPLDAERHLKKSKNGQARYHYKRWESLMQHPISQSLAPNNSSILQSARQKMLSRNALYPNLAELDIAAAFPGLDPAYFRAEQSPAEQYQRLSDFCKNNMEQLIGSNPLSESLFGFHQMFQQTAELLRSYPYLENFEQSLQFYRELLPELSIDLKGEPLKGMQVMGWLETRCLDFDHLVILSLNEGILPKGRSENSLLPFEVKRKFQIPTFLEKDAIFAYHFYRLMQGGQKIDLLYSTSESGMGVVEPSRFIRQLELEWPLKNRRLNFENKIATGQAKPNKMEEEVAKTEAVMIRLQEIAEQGFSPSALYIYLKNPLQFYYERVLGLRPEDGLMEELDLPAQGSAIHGLLEYGFSISDPKDPTKRIAQKPDLEGAFFKQSKDVLKAKLKDFMLAETPGLPLDSGPNLLHLENMAIMLEQFLKAEKKRLQKIASNWDVLAVEQNLSSSLKLANGQIIKLHGNADRIDQLKDGIHIIDYKTGSKEAQEYQIKELSLESLIAKPNAVQLPVYAWMYQQENPQSKVRASILSLKKLKKGPIDMKLEGEYFLQETNQDSVKAMLQDLFKELFDPSIPFKARS